MCVYTELGIETVIDVHASVYLYLNIYIYVYAYLCMCMQTDIDTYFPDNWGVISGNFQPHFSLK